MGKVHARFRRSDWPDPRRFPDWRLAGLGVMLTVGGPAALLSARGWLRSAAGAFGPLALGSDARRWVAEAQLWLPLGALVLFAVGWVLLAAGVWPRGSRRLGVLGSGLLYLVVGLAYWTVVAAQLGHSPGTVLTATIWPPLGLVYVATWPLHAADVLGLFGFRLG